MRSRPATRRSSTDEIETFTENGLKLASGGELDADIVITATGLNLQVMGGIEVAVDGEDVDLSRDGRLQGHDVQRHPERSRSRSATRTRRGRSSAT